MPPATYRIEGGDVPVGVLTLDDGKINSIGFEMIRVLHEALDQAEADEAKALVITGTGKALSAGFDLSVMGAFLGKGGDLALVPKLVEEGGMLLMRVFCFPKPVVSVASGHSLAFGAMLLLAADFRVGRRGSKAKFGLNETAIGLEIPEFGWRLAQYRLHPTHLTVSITQAAIYGAEEAVAVGYLDALADVDPLAVGLAKARQLGGYVKQPAFARMKVKERKGLVDPIIAGMRADIAVLFGAPSASKL